MTPVAWPRTAAVEEPVVPPAQEPHEPDHWLWGGLARCLAALCGLQLLFWVPHYLTWPWWIDHDVFASAARSWEAGEVPYRDYHLNNFPVPIYVFWGLGQLFGWGTTWPAYALDAILLTAAGGLLWRWSGRVFRCALPGIAAFALLVSYYLDLNYALTAQRDWHAPLIVLAAIALLQAWPGRWGWGVAGLLTSIALATRPQVLLFVPALLVTLYRHARTGRSASAGWQPIVAFAVATTVGLAGLFLPLIAVGAFDDFIARISLVTPGASYSRTSLGEVVRQGALQFSPVRMFAVPAVLVLLWRGASQTTRRAAWPWMVAYLGALAYAPLSPVPHAYLRHPLAVYWSMISAILVATIVRDYRRPAPVATAMVLLVLSSGLSLRPRFSDPGRSIRALSQGSYSLVRSPLGYTSMALLPAYAGRYAWPDYQGVLAYVRSLPETTRIGNALSGLPAIAGPTGRLPLFPAESIAWLDVAGSDAEDAFIEALRARDDSVVVWSPGEVRSSREPRFPRLFAAIEAYYVPDKRFGEIEVWRRRRN